MKFVQVRAEGQRERGTCFAVHVEMKRRPLDPEQIAEQRRAFAREIQVRRVVLQDVRMDCAGGAALRAQSDVLRQLGHDVGVA